MNLSFRLTNIKGLNVVSDFLILKNINRTFKSDLKIKWVRPEKILCIKPQKSGDLKPMDEIDKSQFMFDFRESKELETADELVKKLFTLEFAPRKYLNEVYKKELVTKVKRHELDRTSIEARIAKWTGTIRNLQVIWDTLPKENKKMKVFLKELIDKRKKHLKYLRRWDYKKFEWVLENLDIQYKPSPSLIIRITRKESLQKLTTKYCEDIKNERLENFRMLLENEKSSFLEEKIRVLEFIRDEEKECGVKPTVTEEEIDNVKKQLEEIKNKSKNNQDE